MSNLNKKAFTLIELSIVLLVMAFLVGGVLVSKKIIDKAKVQSVIFEIKDLEKAVILFYNNYGCLPGDCPMEILEKYTEFKGKYDTTNNKICILWQCDTENDKARLDTGWLETVKGFHGMRQLELAGYISGVPNANRGAIDSPGSGEGVFWQNNKKNLSGFQGSSLRAGGLEVEGFFQNIKKIKGFDNFISLGTGGANISDLKNTIWEDHNTWITLAGQSTETRLAFFTEVMSTSPDSLIRAQFASKIPKYYATNMIYILNATYGRIINSTAFSSSLMQTIDAKIDDGKPYSGELVAGMMIDHTKRDAISAISKNYCTMLLGKNNISGVNGAQLITDCVFATNCTPENFERANSYQTSVPDSLEQGCNLFYRLPDLE